MPSSSIRRVIVGLQTQPSSLYGPATVGPKNDVALWEGKPLLCLDAMLEYPSWK